MPKTASPKLFNLIKTMTGSEKRYFKVFIGDSQKKYVQLFDAIDAQKTFNEEALQSTIYKNKPIESRKYSELKNYLYELILKSFQAYDEKSSYSYRLQGMMQSVQTLFRRALFEDSKILLTKARKLAQKYEDFNTLIDILRWQKKLAYAQTDIAWLDEQLSKIAEEEALFLSKLSEILDYRNIFYRLLVSIRKGASFRDPEQRKALELLFTDPLLQESYLPSSHVGQVLYHRIYSLYHILRLDWSASLKSSERLLLLMESKPHLLKEDVSEYISSLSNLIAACSVLERYEEMETYLEKFQKIKANTKDDALKIHRQYYLSKFQWCIKTGAFEEGLGAMEAHFKAYRQFDQRLFETSSFYFSYFYLTFGVGDFTKALHYLNQWLALPRSIERQELQSIARIVNLIIHYELGNTLLLQSLLRSTYRFLKSRNELFQFEAKVLQFIRNAEKLLTRKDLDTAMLALRNELQVLANIPSENAMLQVFNVIAWLDSKLEKRSFSEVVRQQYQSQKT